MDNRTKAELKRDVEELLNERAWLKGGIRIIKKHLNETAEMFRSGMAEDSQHNNGIKATVDHFIRVVNERLTDKHETPIEPIDKPCDIFIFDKRSTSGRERVKPT